MFALPVLELENVPMEINWQGHLVFSRDAEGAVTASVAVKLRARDETEWFVDEIHIGPQRLVGMAFSKLEADFSHEKSAIIKDHIRKHLGASTKTGGNNAA
jgi:hypothetical protein